MIWVAGLVTLSAVALLMAMRNEAMEQLAFREWSRARAAADAAVLARIEKKLEDISEAIESEGERIVFGQEFHAGKVNEFTKAEVKVLVDVMREVVHETPDFAITGEDGEVPVRRMRGLRSALFRMEELSRIAAGE